jgi:hypothetical protein
MLENNEVVHPSEDQRKKEAYDRATHLGRVTVNLAKDRATKRFMPFVDPQRLSGEDISHLGKKEKGEVSEEDIQAALESSFALVFESAAQIAEVRFPPGQVREDLESLVALGNNVKAGVKLARELGDDTKQREVILRETRRVLAKRKNVPPESLQITDEELQKSFEEIYWKAINRIGRSIDSLRGYLGR